MKHRHTKATNDWLISSFLDDPLYLVSESGEIYTRKGIGRQILNHWRIAGWIDKEGYREIQYRGYRLKAHRIVYRKFNGELDENKVIDHLDATSGHNHPTNLELVTMEENLKRKAERQRQNAIQSAA